MKPIIYPYKIWSKSARALARKLNTICIREKGKYKPRNDHRVINWGNPRQPKWPAAVVHWLNAPYPELQRAQNKLDTFRVLKEHKISTPEWTTDRKEAEKWIENEFVVVCRTFLRGSAGSGIVLSTVKTELVNAPLYVQYKKKKKEFRVHVFRKQVIDVQQKRRANGAAEEENYNQYIRSHANGWIYAREDIVEPKELRSLAIGTVTALGLDFGGVDIIYNEKENKCFVLEVNTAPGLEGTTLDIYANAIKTLCTK